MVLENNIFKYATKELTQDAFICWVLSYYNKPENKKLHSIAKNLIKKIIQKYKLKLPNHIEIVQQRTVSYKDEQ
ncbi:MAG: hypothetical protein KKH40_08145, partial [Nanoarchaeota archaeon]|nr:hypothetical protein [Nanoarchaeota archaeon]